MVKLYVEGGGSELLDSLCRKGFQKFLLSAGLGGKMPRVFASGSRQDAYDAFVTAMKYRRPGELPLLLVDSEAPVSEAATPWQHLRTRDGWTRPKGAEDDQAFLMVQCMESWFLADREVLIAFFGQHLNKTALPARPDVEAIPKVQVFDALKAATAPCGKKQYAKGKLSFELLGAIRATIVAAASPHAARLLARLRVL